MYKELNGVNTLGLKNPDKINGKMMMEKLRKVVYQRITDNNYDNIMNSIYENNYKYVDEKLEPLIGVYPMPSLQSMVWTKEFVKKFLLYATIENLFITKKYGLVDINAKRSDFIKVVNDLTDRLNKADYEEGTLLDEHNRNVKILKYIKQQLKKFFAITDVDYDKEDFVMFYNINKTAKKDTMNLVITNSVAALIGMSSYPTTKKNGEHTWSSCQSVLYTDSGYMYCTPANITDRGSLICYITDGDHVPFLTDSYILENAEHQQMYARYMIRLLEADDGTICIALDRGYPNPMYTMHILKLLSQLVEGTELRIALHNDYNMYQSERDTAIEKAYNQLKNSLGRYINARSYCFNNIIKVRSNDCEECYTMYSYEGCSECDNCSNCDNRDCDRDNVICYSGCSECRHRTIDCDSEKCTDCEHCPCKDNYEKYTHYDDQIGCSSPQRNSDTNDEVYKLIGYEVYIDMKNEIKDVL